MSLRGGHQCCCRRRMTTVHCRSWVLVVGVVGVLLLLLVVAGVLAAGPTAVRITTERIGCCCCQVGSMGSCSCTGAAGTLHTGVIAVVVGDQGGCCRRRVRRWVDGGVGAGLVERDGRWHETVSVGRVTVSGGGCGQCRWTAATRREEAAVGFVEGRQ